MKKIILTLLSLALAVILKLMLDLGLLKSVNPINSYADCKYLKQDITGPEDIVPYKNNSLITVSGNLVEIFYSEGPYLQHSTFYAIMNADKNTEAIKLEMLGFPNNIALYVHGIYIQEQPEGDLLYAINHAYNFGGERIEVFYILPNFTLVHNTSILLGSDYFGRLNDLVVVSSSRILSTLWMPYPEPEIGRKGQTLLDKFWILVNWASRQKQTHVLDCHVSRQSKTTTPNCKILEVSASVVNNGIAGFILGITWDRLEKVWVADSLGGIREFQITQTGLEYRRLLEVNDGIDNIEYEPLTNSLIIATLPKLYNHLQLDYYLSKGNKFNRQTEFEYWGGVVRYHLETNVQEVLIQGKYLSKGLSAASVAGKYLYLGSFCDISVMVCRKI